MRRALPDTVKVFPAFPICSWLHILPVTLCAYPSSGGFFFFRPPEWLDESREEEAA